MTAAPLERGEDLRAVAGGLFRQFAVLAYLIYLAYGVVTLAVLTALEGGARAFEAGVVLLGLATIALLGAFVRGTTRTQAWVGVAAGALCGLAVTPPPWREAGQFTVAHVALALPAAPVIGVAAAVGMGRSLPTLVAATGMAMIGLHGAHVPFRLGQPLGILIVWLNGGVLIAFARRGFRLAAEALDEAVAAETAYLRQHQDWRIRRRRDALLHDTVLATIDLLAHDDRRVPREQIRAACRRDLELLRGERGPAAGSLPDTASGAGVLPVGYPGLDELAAECALLGLRVNLSMGHGLPVPVPPSWPECLMAARECLRNVAFHARVADADLAVTAVGDEVVVTVVDGGVGFDTGSVPAERLGLRRSVVDRLALSDGSARVWSSPGRGTCVMLRIPSDPFP